MADPQEGLEPQEDEDVEAHRRMTEDEPIDEFGRRRRAADDLPLGGDDDVEAHRRMTEDEPDEDRARRRR